MSDWRHDGRSDEDKCRSEKQGLHLGNALRHSDGWRRGGKQLLLRRVCGDQGSV